MTQISKEEFPRPLMKVVQTLKEAGNDSYIVGGSLRSLLIGCSVSDWDLATSALPEKVMEIFPGAIPTGLKHGTVTVVLGGMPIEITTFRVESDYRDARHPEQVTFVRTIEEDLKRRDFTINAMACNPLTMQVIDLFQGKEDLDRGIIRAVGNPVERFNEDGLRPYRAVRLAVQLDFEIEEHTFQAISDSLEAAGAVSIERVREEFNKILLAERPSRGIELLRVSGLLQLFLPEFAACYGVTQNRFHQYDVYEHSLRCCDGSPGLLEIRLAALLHDIGKPPAREFDADQKDYTFYRHENVGADMVQEIMVRMKYAKAVSRTVLHLIQHHMVRYTPEWTDSAVRRFMGKIGRGNLKSFFMLRDADSRAHLDRMEPPDDLKDLKERIEEINRKGQALEVSDLQIDGNDVMEYMEIPPGEAVGAVLNRLLEAVLENPGLNTRERLFELLKKQR